MQLTQEIQTLIARGRAEGELTYEEIIDALPEAFIDIDAIEGIIESLRTAGIEVIRADDPLKERLVKTLEGEGISWILNSSLTERAYWIGAQRAAKLLGAGKRNETGLVEKLLGTLHHRSADDTFRSTRLGETLANLVEAIHREDFSLDAIHGHLDSLCVTLEDLTTVWQREVRHVKALIQESRRIVEVVRETVTFDPERELSPTVSALERPLRTLSLVETSHDIQYRFDQTQSK